MSEGVDEAITHIISRSILMVVLMVLVSMTTCKVNSDGIYSIVEKAKAESCYTEQSTWNSEPKLVDYCGGKLVNQSGKVNK